MLATTQSQQASHRVSKNKDQHGRQQDLKPAQNSSLLLPDLTKLLKDVQVPQPPLQLQEQTSVSEISSLSCPSVESNNASENDSVNLQKWFDDFNAHPEKGASKYSDTASPYFLQRDPTNSSRENSELAPLPELSYNCRGGGSDDYRSVIDDLTIENQRLRKKLRRYKKQTNTKLEKDRLFEIKIHDVPSAKRRELENALRSFASSIDLSRCQIGSSMPSSMNQSLSQEGVFSSEKKSMSTSTTNSQLEQSSYDSMMTSTLPTTINSEVFTLKTDKSASLQSRPNPCESQNYDKCSSGKLKSPLHKKGLGEMSDRQKKKLVVQRLEQIFTGEKGVILGPNQASIQDENSIQISKKEPTITLGRIREAQMIPQENYIYSRPTGPLNDLGSKPSSSTSDETNSCDSFSDQRPTRPLELDPDRTQIPSDNVQYIRHLGLATPKLAADDGSENASKEGEGWVYLNLLINMAQLHIINVTPDFVRSAVVDVSEKFQLSKDGQMLRWKGGTQGTHLCNDENSCSGQESDTSKSSDQDMYELQKKEKSASHRFKSNSLNKPHCNSSGFHYKPLFSHQTSSERTSTTSESPPCQSHADELSGQNTWGCPRSRHRQSFLTGKKHFEDGSLVFYRGVDFCVDLCGDPEITLPQSPNSSSEEESESDNILCSASSVVPIERTSSGSSLPYRPFKDISSLDVKYSSVLETSSNPSDSASNCELDLSKFPTQIRQEPISSQLLQPCGIGGAQISDHFEIHVVTQHMSDHSNTSGNGSPMPKKINENIKPHTHNQLPNDTKAKHDEDYKSNQPTPLVSKSPLLISSCQKAPPLIHSYVQTRIISSETINLPASQVPSPALLQYSSDSDIEISYNVGLTER